MEANKNLGGLDYFKIIAAFLIIAIHTSPLSSLSSSADFILTRIIARIAVPFFLMVTGYFMLPSCLFHKSRDIGPLFRWIKKVLLFYAAGIVIYLPVNLYAGQLNGIGLPGVLRMILFDGTFYHLWYFPASILGMLLVYFLARKLPVKAVMGIALLLYTIGLFGDSYFGLTEHIPFIRAIYNMLFQIFSYTRNGIFFVPVFLVMGAWITCFLPSVNQKGNVIGLFTSFVLMLVEGLLLHRYGEARHDSMYIGLLPCMFFLYQLIANIKKKPVKSLRTISTCIYLVHPLFIIFVRGSAKALHLEAVLIGNSLIHYIAVSTLSCLFSLFLVKLFALKKESPFHKERAWIELNRKNLHKNIFSLHDLLPPNCLLMPAVKANAYGHGAVLIAKELNACGVKNFCVATANEGIKLRCHGIKGDILVLGYTHPKQFPLLRRYHLVQTVIDSSYAAALHAYGKKIKVHIKIDTGMHRLGIPYQNMEELCRIFQYKNLQVEGAYTHLCADETTSAADQDFTLAQGNAFYNTVSRLKELGYDCHKIHLQASYGLLNYPELAGDYVRIGIALYGVLSTQTDIEHCRIKLSPVLSVKARIAAIKDLHQGETAGYGFQYIAAQDRKIAVLTIGYADGLPRSLSCGLGSVLIHGRKAPVIGRICMDQTLVDITGIPDIYQGDIAIIIGKDGESEITAYDIAKQTGTITNEVLSRLGNRLDRIIV